MMTKTSLILWARRILNLRLSKQRDEKKTREEKEKEKEKNMGGEDKVEPQ